MPPKKATKRKKPLKMLIYGPSGVGKTHFALFATPGRTLVFDMEGGTDLFEGRVDFDFWTDDDGYKTQSYRELRKCIDYLKTPEGRNNYSSFVIDPVTLIWTLLQQERQDYKEEKALEKRRGREKENETDLETFTTRDWNIVKKMHKGVIDEISALPQNVFLVAREKPVVIMKNGEPVQTGEITFEGEKNTIYAVDFAFRIWVDIKTQKRYCQIAKDRSGHYQTGDVIQNPTFELFNEIVNSMADGEKATTVRPNTENTFSEAEQSPNNTTYSNNHKYICSVCLNEINQAINEYSTKYFGRPLCRECQKLEKDTKSGNSTQQQSGSKSKGWPIYAEGKTKGLRDAESKVLIWAATNKQTDSTKK